MLSPRGIGREVAFGLLGALAYFGVRVVTEGDVDDAYRNAEALVDVERALGFFWEVDLQNAIIDYGWLVTFMNWVYMWGHWPFIGVVAIWLLWRHPSTYQLYRSAFLISGLIGLVVFATFPVAPPRLADLAVIDTLSEQSHSYKVLQSPSFVNQYAAMPSLHVGWNLLIGIAVITSARHWPVKAIGVVSPILMVLAVVFTANHYIIDAPAGAALALFGLLVAYMVRRLHRNPPAWWPPQLSSGERGHRGFTSAGARGRGW